MRKLPVILTGLLVLVGSASALSAQITPRNPNTTVLNSTNNYEKQKWFNGTSSTGDITSYNWQILDSSQSDSGTSARFTFNKENSSSSETIRLTVTNSTGHTDTAQVTQSIRDVPRIKATRSDLEFKISSGGSKSRTFNATADYSINNTFNPPLSYSWDLDDANGSDVATGSGETFSHSFGTVTAGDNKYELNLTVTDNKGYGNSDASLGIDVDRSSSSDSGSSSSSDSSSDDSGGGVGTTSMTTEDMSFDRARDVVTDANGREKLSFEDEVLSSMSVTTADTSVGTLDFSSSERMPDEAARKPGETAYRYLEVKEDFVMGGQIEKATFDFRVENSWLESNSIAEDSVKMQRYSDGAWSELDTNKTGSDSDYTYYESVSPGLSVFAITGEKAEPQFSITDLTVTSENITVGDQVEIEVEVKNSGNAEGDYTVSLQIGNRSVERTVANLSAGSSRTVEFTETVESSGSVSVAAGAEQTSFNVKSVDAQTREARRIPLLPILGVFFLVLLLAAVAFLYSREENMPEGMTELTDRLENGEEDGDEDFDWEGFS